MTEVVAPIGEKAVTVADTTDTVAGYVEFYYWLNYYCNPTSEPSAMSQANWD